MKNIELKKFAGTEKGCLGGACPTVYRSEDGRFFIQGYVVTKAIKGSVNVPTGENLVEIPEQLLRNAAKHLMDTSK